MFLSADRIHDGNKFLPAGTIIEVAEDDTIIAIHTSQPASQKGRTITVYYTGILCPGFVNAHCHLELSHLKGVIPEGISLIPFLKHIPLYRNDFSEEQKAADRKQAYNELLTNGIVAVGDICNTADTLDLRTNDKLHIHSFVESMGFTQTPNLQFEYAVQVHDAFETQQRGDKHISQSIAPHAPYSVSEELFDLIDKHDPDAIISIHNQESIAENEYYLEKKGKITELLKTLGIDDAFFEPSGRSSLQTYLGWVSSTHPVIFVHNTYTTREDVETARKLLLNVYWCLCPNANMYIEGRLPDIDMFVREKANICIGTDSLASNNKLSILAELCTIKEHYPRLSWETLLTWGTSNGAKALQMQDKVGTLTVGTRPGVLHLSNLDSPKPGVSRIV